MTRVRIYGLDRLMGKFSQMERGLPDAMKETTEEAIIYVHSKLPDYPPQPVMSTYRRTLTLWRTITGFQGTVPDALARVEKLFGEIQGFVGTRLKYAPWVIDRDNQTRAHKANGWWNLQDEVLKVKDGIVKVYEKGIDKFVRSIF